MKQVALLVVFVITSVCGYSQSTDFSNPQTAEDMVAAIEKAAGFSSHFRLKTSDKVIVSEAFIKRRKKYILYNPNFFNGVSKITQDKWASIALLAHEIGHHVKGHTSRRGGSNHAVELQADEFAGTVLGKMGATLEEAQIVMQYISSVKGSESHPPRKDRMVAIQQGWNKATGGKREDHLARNK